MSYRQSGQQWNRHKIEVERFVFFARENASGIRMINPASKNTGMAMTSPVKPSAHAAFSSPNVSDHGYSQCLSTARCFQYSSKHRTKSNQ